MCIWESISFFRTSYSACNMIHLPTRWRHLPMHAQIKQARQVETEIDRAMNARSNRKEMSDERHLETSGERCAESKRGDERWTPSQSKDEQWTPSIQWSHCTIHNNQPKAEVPNRSDCIWLCRAKHGKCAALSIPTGRFHTPSIRDDSDILQIIIESL